MSIDRRRFLQILGAGGSAAALSCSRPPETDPGGADAAVVEPDLEWAKAPCRFCGAGCGVEVGVRDGQVVDVRGDEAHPVNAGLLCVKGQHLPDALHGVHRLAHPHRRYSDGRVERISWDQALELIAAEYDGALNASGPEAVGLYGSGQWGIHDGYAATKWMKAGLGSNNIDSSVRLGMSSAAEGFLAQFGSDAPIGGFEDLDAGEDFVIWGSNMAETQPVLFRRLLETKRRNPDVRIVDISPRWTPTTEHADLHVQIRPGSDAALANALLHVLVSQGMVDWDFVRENLVFRRGLENLEAITWGLGEDAERFTFEDRSRRTSVAELQGFLADYAPERATEATGIPVEVIEQLAAIYGDPARGTVTLFGTGVEQQSRGTWTTNLITDLHLLTGKIARPGSNPLGVGRQPSSYGSTRDVGATPNGLPAGMLLADPAQRARAEELWGLEPQALSAVPGHHAVDLFRAFTRGDVRVLWVQASNPMASLPNLHRFERTPGDGSFLIVSDIYPTSTTRMADLVLPSATWVEREGVYGSADRRTQHWSRMIEPPAEAREDAWQILQVAQRMGMGDLFPWPEEAWHEPMYEEYRRFTLGTGRELASYQELRDSRGLRWPVVEGQETAYRYAAGHDPLVAKEQGVHFYDAKGDRERASVWLRPHQPSAEEPDDEFPFWLDTGRALEHWLTGTVTQRVPALRHALSETYVEIHPEDAAELGVETGDRARVSSRRGALEVAVKVGERGRPARGSVFMPFFDEHQLTNLLTLDALDNISKAAALKKCAVRLERT